VLTDKEIEAKLENDWDGLDQPSLVSFIQDEFLEWLEYNAPDASGRLMNGKGV